MVRQTKIVALLVVKKGLFDSLIFSENRLCLWIQSMVLSGQGP
jgi:hypothetical protein